MNKIRPITLIDNLNEDEDDESCYEEMEDDEDVDEYITNEPDDDPSTHEDVHIEQGSSNDHAKSVEPETCCSVCQRCSNERYLLFKWPMDKRIRINWANMLGVNESSLLPDSLICSFHFSSAHFSYVNGRVFWEKNAFPRYRNERSDDEPPFPWEIQTTRLMKQAQDSEDHPPEQLMRAPARTMVDHENYAVSYRRSYYKNKNRNAHEVAIVSKIDANIYHEFAYNRTSPIDGTKFYSCLGCRKAKVDTQVKDVIRTIHIGTNSQILSKGDPFYGHHYACLPFSADDIKSYRPSVPQPMHMDMSVVYAHSDDVIYMDEDGNPTETVWNGAESDSLINIEDIPFYGELNETKPNLDINEIQERPPKLCRMIKLRSRRRKRSARPNIKCHICFLRLQSTKDLITHLQAHVDNSPNCVMCERKLSTDAKFSKKQKHVICPKCVFLTKCKTEQ